MRSGEEGGRRKEEGGRRRTSARSRASDIKSNNPHLAGGEKYNFRPIFGKYNSPILSSMNISQYFISRIQDLIFLKENWISFFDNRPLLYIAYDYKGLEYRDQILFSGRFVQALAFTFLPLRLSVFS